jgi:transposase, IS30 family
MASYTHLTSEERFYIHQAVRERKSISAIAQRLSRNKSTISREIRRNKWPSAKIYTHHIAEKLIRHRKSRKARHMPKKVTSDIKQSVVFLLMHYLSPEQISGYLKQRENISISHETIYRHIYNDSNFKDLKCYLRQGHKKRRKRYGSNKRRSIIPNRVSINERPDIVNTRQRIGDWECDTVIGAGKKGILVTVTERKTLFSLSAIVHNKTARTVSDAIIKMLRPYKDKVKTLTFDNGTEFAEHLRIAKALKAKTFFANPYSSWERGANENFNGLLRQFFPKGKSFADITQKFVDSVISLLNNRPRKSRNYKTPNELFNKYFEPLIV